MNHRKPPALAKWMLDHLTSTESNEALSGDLLEAFRTDRSAGWYWHQVIAAILIAWGRNLWRHRGPLCFAAVWSAFSPAWGLLNIRFYESSHYPDVWRIPFPWSTVCQFAILLAAAMLFIWFGVAIYAAFCLLASDNFRLRSVLKGLPWGLLAFALAQVCLLTIAIYHPLPASHAPNWRNLTMLGVTEDFGTWYALVRIPFLIGTATTLWFLASGSRSDRVRVA